MAYFMWGTASTIKLSYEYPLFLATHLSLASVQHLFISGCPATTSAALYRHAQWKVHAYTSSGLVNICALICFHKGLYMKLNVNKSNP